MNSHQSSNNPDNLPLPVTIHTKSQQLPFNSYWNVRVVHNLPPNTSHITCRHFELAYQFVLSIRHSHGINLRLFPFNFPSIPPPFLSPNPLGGTFKKLSRGSVFIVCSHTFTLFWSRNNIKGKPRKVKWDTYLTHVCRHCWNRKSFQPCGFHQL